MNPQTLDHVAYADQFPGTDMGAKIDAAQAALPITTGQQPCGRVIVPAGLYSFSTTIVKLRCVLLEGAASNGTILNWVPTTGVALAIGDQNSQYTGPNGDLVAMTNTYPLGGISDIQISGSGSGNATIGMWLGGDPTGTVLPSGDYGDHQVFTRFSIGYFGTGVEFGNNAPFTEFHASDIHGNNVGVTAASAATNTNENNKFIGGALVNNIGGAFVNASEPDIHLIGTSLDFNNACTNAPCTQAAITNTNITMTDVHLEQNAGPAIYNETADTENRIFGGSITLDSTASGTDACLICVTGVAPDLTINGTDLYSAHTVTDAVEFTSSNGAGSLVIRNPLGGLNNFTNLYPSALQSSIFTDVTAPLANQLTVIPGSQILTNGPIHATFDGSGGGLELTDNTNAAPTPNKFFSVYDGDLRILNSAASVAIWTLSDAGAMGVGSIQTNSISIGGGTALATSNQTGTGSIAMSASPIFTGTVTAATLNATTLEQGSQAVVLKGVNGISAGTVTLVAGAGSHTFGTAYSAAPVCTATDTTAANVVQATSSTTAVTLAGTGTDVVAWQCSAAVN